MVVAVEEKPSVRFMIRSKDAGGAAAPERRLVRFSRLFRFGTDEKLSAE
jgi:hypothetical protein